MAAYPHGMDLCAVAECERPKERRQWCGMHYARWRRHGDASFSLWEVDYRDRIRAKVLVDENGCWLWQGAVSPTGYGQGSFGGRFLYVHRVSYEAFVGPIPEGLQIDHLCRVRRCCNPMHLEPVTVRENLMRGNTMTARRAGITHCPQGHAYDEANTYVSPKEGGRACRACRKIHSRASNRKRRAMGKR